MDFTAKLSTLVGLEGGGEMLHQMAGKSLVSKKKKCKTIPDLRTPISRVPPTRPLPTKGVRADLEIKVSWTGLNFVYTLSSLINDSTRYEVRDLYEDCS